MARNIPVSIYLLGLAKLKTESSMSLTVSLSLGLLNFIHQLNCGDIILQGRFYFRQLFLKLPQQLNFCVDNLRNISAN